MSKRGVILSVAGLIACAVTTWLIQTNGEVKRVELLSEMRALLGAGDPSKVYEKARKHIGLDGGAKFACVAMEELAYGIIDERSVDWSKAVSLADQLNLEECDLKSIVIAEARHGPEGSAPHQGKFELALLKYAIIIYYGRSPSHFDYLIGKGSGDGEAPDIQRPPPYDKSSVVEYISGMKAERMALLTRAVNMRDDVVALMDETPPCDLANRALGHWFGGDSWLQDKELAEIFLTRAASRTSEPDILYAHGVLGPRYTMNPISLEEAKRRIRVASGLGHPRAALAQGTALLASGDFPQALLPLLVADLAGVAEAVDLSRQARSGAKARDVENARSEAASLLEMYQGRGCALRMEALPTKSH